MSAPQPRRRRWRRWLGWSAIALVAGRLLLALLLPWLLGLGAGAAGLALDYRSAHLSLTWLSLRLDDVVLRDAALADAGAPPLLCAQEVFVDASTWQLLHGELVVVDAAMAGVRVHLVRNADGQLRLPAAWQAPTPTGATQPPSPPLRLEAPLQVVSARLHDLRVDVEATDPAASATFTLDATVADFGRSDRPCLVTARTHSPGLLDELWLQAQLELQGGRANLQWQASARGLRPASLPWLDGPVTTPRHHVVGIDANGSLQAATTTAGSPPDLTTDVDMRLQIDEREQLAISVRAGPSQLDGRDWLLPVDLKMHGDDLVDELQLAASLRQGAEVTRCSGTLRSQGTTLRLLAPWLQSLGVTMPAAGLALRADLTATTREQHLDAEITNLRLGNDLAATTLPRLAVRDLQSTAGAMHIGAIEVDGPQLALAQDENGAIEVLGMRIATPTAAAATTTVPTTPAAPFAWPQLALDQLAWRSAQLQFTDRSLPSPAELTIAVDVQGTQLALGQPVTPGQLTANVHVPGALEALRIDVALTPTSETLGIEGKVDASGVTARSLAPWLQRAGMAPLLQNGTVRALVTADLRAKAGNLAIDAKVANVRFQDGENVLLSLRHVDGAGCRLGAELDLGTWTIDEPYVLVQRDIDGSLHALGLQFGAAPAAAGAAVPAPAPIVAPAPPTGPAAGEVRHGDLTVRGAVVHWIDRSRDRPADVSLGSDLRVGSGNATGAPTAFEADLRVEPAAGKFALRGVLQRDAAGGRVDVDVTGEKLRGAGLQPLLPPHIACMLEDGHLRSHLRAGWQLAPSLSLDLGVAGFALEDRGAELLALDALDVRLPQVTAERVHIATANVRGLRGVAASTVDGLHLLGLQLAAAPAITRSATAGPQPAAPADGGISLPLVRLDELDLQLERFVWRERGTTDGEPLLVSARLTLAEPWATAASPADTPPCQLVLTAAATPLCQHVELRAALAPFALAPTLDIDVRATGIDTTAIARVAPSLQDTLHGTCDNATFTTSVHCRLDLRRRDPLRFDLTRAFGGELAVEGADLIAGAAGTTLLHVDDVLVDLRAFDPQTGDVLLRSIEVEGPRLTVDHGAAGLGLLGLRLPQMSADGGAPPVADANPPPPSPLAVGGARPAEIAVDRLQLLGVDITYTDQLTQPPTVLPLRDTDLKVRNLSTLALSEPRMIAFQMAVRGGDVELERRVLHSSVFAGLLGSAAEALAGASDQYEMEQRPLVDEISLSGQVQAYPRPQGDVRLAVSSFELPALRGLAKAAGVDIGDGVLDLDVETRLLGAQGVQVRARPTFTWLSLSEPPGGPLSTYLKLPAPLDTVLFALRNDDDEHVLPLQLQLPPEGLSGGAVAAAAAGALAHLIADALASAAFRVGGMVTGAVGLGGSDTDRLAGTLEFAAGDPLPAGGSLAEVIAAAAADHTLTIVLRHELGAGDLERAGELACPPAGVIQTAAARLREERARLEHERGRLGNRTAALFGSGRMQDAWEQQRLLHDVDARLGALVQTQEEALRMLAGENERALRRRTRAGAVTLAEARLGAVRQQVQRQLGDADGRRIQLRTPRGVLTEGLPAGGRVLATVRRSAAP